MMTPIALVLVLAAAIANATPAPAAVGAASQLNHLVDQTVPPRSFVGNRTGVWHISSALRFNMLILQSFTVLYYWDRTMLFLS